MSGAKPNAFGFQNQNTETPFAQVPQTPTATGGPFGQTQTSTATGGLFGTKPVARTFGQPTTGFTFGTTPAATATGNTGGLFGQNPGQATGNSFPPQSSNPFGTPTPGFGGFGTTSTPATGGFFGQQHGSSPLFGQPSTSVPQTPTATGGPFGQTQTSTATVGLFGTTPAAGTFGQPSTGFTFGTTPAAAATGNTGGLFGQKAGQATGNSFPPQSSNPFGTPTAGFGGFGTTSTSATGGFFGQQHGSSPLFGQPSTNVSEDVPGVRKSHYIRKKNQRGFMVIINFTENRPGSQTDVVKMSSFFEDIGWNVEKKQDMTYEELQTFLRELQKLFEDKRFAEKFYAFCLVLMSHGDEKGIKTDDGKSYPLDDVVKFFKNDRMPEFAGKPKMFLIQECRGSGEQEAVSLPGDDKVNISDYVGKLSIPTDSDILIAYATTPGYRSYRKVHNYTGSWFLNEILEVFEREYKREHVEEMLITVKENVAYNPEYSAYNKTYGKPDGARQMPCSWSTFTKRLYLS